MKTRKLPKLNLACSKDNNRPTMQHVYVGLSDVVATDGKILVKHQKSELFDNSLDEIDYSILIHADHWKLLTKPFILLQLDSESEQILVQRKNGNFDVCPFKKESDFEKLYPNYNAIIPTEDKIKELSTIRMSTDLLNKLGQALSSDDKQMKFEFTDNYGAVVVTPLYANCGSVGIIMPC